MEVLKRVKILKKNPAASFMDDSLNADCGALHLHHPEWYRNGGNGYNDVDFMAGVASNLTRSQVNLVSYEDFHSLSSIQLGLRLSSSNKTSDEAQLNRRDVRPVSSTTPPPGSMMHAQPNRRGILNKMKSVRGATKLKVRSNLGDMKLLNMKKKSSNEVFRSNSFRFEKGDVESAELLSASLQPQSAKEKVILSDDYHSPKDLVNRLPLLAEEDDLTSVPSTPSESITNTLSDSKKPELFYSDVFLARLPSSASSSSKFSRQSKNELLLELQYSDPADSKLYTEPGADPDETIYKLYVGGEYYYCRPYKPVYQSFHTVSPNLQPKPNETSIYEDVSGSTNDSNNNCVTIISVSPNLVAACNNSNNNDNNVQSMHYTDTEDDYVTSTTFNGSETSSEREGSFTINSITRTHGSKCSCNFRSSKKAAKCRNEEPPYENVDFHRVKISVPGSCKRPFLHDVTIKRPEGVTSRSPLIPPSVNSRVIRRPRVNTRPKTQTNNSKSVSDEYKKKFEKFGYSKNEVWNWLYTDKEKDEEQELEGAAMDPCSGTDKLLVSDLYSVPLKGKSKLVEEKTVEVQFSPQEFFNASNRLAHLDLDGLEHFVGNTLEKAIIKSRKRERENTVKESNYRDMVGQQDTDQKEDRTMTITEVPAHNSLDVRTETVCSDGGQAAVGGDSGENVEPTRTCQTCLNSGESSCSSALSSLESVRSSSGHSSQNTNISRSSTCSGSETLASEMPISPTYTFGGASNIQQQHLPGKNPSKGPLKPARNFVIRSGQQNTLVNNNNNNAKPYQTLEVINPNGQLENHNELYDIPKLVSDVANSYRYIPMYPSGIKPIFIDPSLPLGRQEWFHGNVTRIEAETVLRLHKEGSYLVRNSESSRQDFSLSVKSARGFMHMRIQKDSKTEKFILGQFSKPFNSVPEMVHYYTLNRLPIKGAEHMCLLKPICEQLL